MARFDDGRARSDRYDRRPIPFDCVDGFNEAYYGRPEMLLDPRARSACSAWSFVDAAGIARFETRLSGDLASGRMNRLAGIREVAKA